MRKKIAVLVYNYRESAMGTRAKYLFKYFPKNKYKISIIYRKSNNFIDTIRFTFLTLIKRPDTIYMTDIGLPSLIASSLMKLHPFRKAQIIVDTGDLIYLSLKKSYSPNRVFLGLVKIIEQASFNISDKIIVRGSHFKEYLENRGYKNVHFIPDGIDANFSKPMNVKNLRKRLGLEKYLTIGVMGTLDYSKKLDLCYGWELVEALKYLKNLPVKGIIIGDGIGRKILEDKAKAYGVFDKLIFLGRLPYSKIPRYLNLMDICLLTVPNHILSRIRTTGKLPEYLACGRFIIASDVGEAKNVIKNNGILIRYYGIKDFNYVKKLVKEIKRILRNKGILNSGKLGIDIAKRKYEYKLLSSRLKTILSDN